MAKQTFYIRAADNSALGTQQASFPARAIALFIAKNPAQKAAAVKAITLDELAADIALAGKVAAEVEAIRGWSLPAVIVDNGADYRNGDRIVSRSLSDALHYKLADKIVGMNPVAKRVLEAARA